MRFGSVCSGIEDASQAWGPLGWSPAFFSEIEKFPSAVLAHHYGSNMPSDPPSQNGVPNYGDMTNFEGWPDHGPDSDDAIDLLCGGTPCQSFSIAGLRKGLDDQRGNLSLTFGAIARRYRPRWLVWENVPGVLSSNSGQDFASILGLLAGCSVEPPKDGWQKAGYVAGYKNAYGLAWRVLDAQYIRVDGFERAVPQRRRRVVLVGYIGDWRRAAAVLFERESLCGHSAPRREAGQRFAADVAPSLISSGRGVERAGETRGQDPVVADMLAIGEYGDGATASTLKARDYKDATDLVAFDCKGSEVQSSIDGAAPTLRSMSADKSHANAGGHAAVAFAQNTRDEVRLVGGDGGVSGALAAEAGMKQQSYVAQPYIGGVDNENNAFSMDDVCGPLIKDSPTGGGRPLPAIAWQWAVRRLTPVECERLQGFPDNFTRIPWRGKEPENCPDGPRYKALGNSWAVNMFAWVGRRIEMVERLAGKP